MPLGQSRVESFTESLLLLTAIVLITIMFGLVRTLGINADVLSLFLSELAQFHIEVVKMETRHFLVQFLGKEMYADVVLVRLSPKGDLCKDLAGGVRSSALKHLNQTHIFWSNSASNMNIIPGW